MRLQLLFVLAMALAVDATSNFPSEFAGGVGGGSFEACSGGSCGFEQVFQQPCLGGCICSASDEVGGVDTWIEVDANGHLHAKGVANNKADKKIQQVQNITSYLAGFRRTAAKWATTDGEDCHVTTLDGGIEQSLLSGGTIKMRSIKMSVCKTTTGSCSAIGAQNFVFYNAGVKVQDSTFKKFSVNAVAANAGVTLFKASGLSLSLLHRRRRALTTGRRLLDADSSKNRNGYLYVQAKTAVSIQDVRRRRTDVRRRRRTLYRRRTDGAHRRRIGAEWSFNTRRRGTSSKNHCCAVKKIITYCTITSSNTVRLCKQDDTASVVAAQFA